jgi:16S rRNA processing protein RimM
MNPERGRLVLVGWIVGTHGVRGEVRVKPCAGSPDRFRGVARAVLGPADAEADVDADADVGVGAGVCAGRNEYRPVDLESARPHGSLALLRIAGIADIDSALAMRGMGLYLPASELPRLPEGEFYSFELVGLTCESTTGERLGVVVEVLEMPANDVLLVRPEEGPDFLVPAANDIVHQVDLAGGRLVIDDRPGLR